MSSPSAPATRPPRVAFDVTAAVRQGGGIGRYTRELARALVERQRVALRLVVADRVAPSEVRAAVGAPTSVPVASATLPGRWLTVLWHRMRLPLGARSLLGDAALWHAPDFLAPRLARPTVVTVHDLSFLVHPERADPALARFLSARIGPAVRGAAHVLADSESTRRDLEERLGVDPARVSVAYPGVSAGMREERDPARLEAVRRRHGLTRPFVLGVGTMEPRKDWPTLVRAFEAANLEGMELVLAGGRGWRGQALDRALAEARAPVRRLGFVTDDDLPALYTLARAFAYPSVYEGFGLPPLEAMACGTPTAVSDVSSLPEVVGSAALRLPPGDVGAWSAALRRLVDDPELREQLAARGPEQAAAFTWHRCASAVEGAYARVLERDGRERDHRR